MFPHRRRWPSARDNLRDLRSGRDAVWGYDPASLQLTYVSSSSQGYAGDDEGSSSEETTTSRFLYRFARFSFQARLSISCLCLAVRSTHLFILAVTTRFRTMSSRRAARAMVTLVVDN